MTADSAPELLVLHAVRLVGFADTDVLARRFGLDPDETGSILLDAEAYGWVQHTEFAGAGGWSLTEPGRAENERQLATELAGTGRADAVRGAYREFLPLNGRLQRACTDWQLRPVGTDRLAANEHDDPAWDARVLAELGEIEDALDPLATLLAEVRTRFAGYHARFAAALGRARAGQLDWVDRTELDSCHRVWFELHEDLVATLGVPRGAEPPTER